MLTEGGQFFLDSAAGKVYYKPLSGEDMGSVQAYLGVSEVLVAIGGSYAEPVHDIFFQDLNFVSGIEIAEVAMSNLSHRRIRHGFSLLASAMLINRREVISAKTKHMIPRTLSQLARIGARCHLQYRSAQLRISFFLVETTPRWAEEVLALVTMLTPI